MWRVRDRFSVNAKVSILRIALLSLIAVTILGSLYISNHHDRFVMAARPGLDGPAAQYLTQGDIIMSINRHDVNSLADFNKLAAEAKGQALLRIMRNGQAAFVVIPDQSEGQ